MSTGGFTDRDILPHSIHNALVAICSVASLCPLTIDVLLLDIHIERSHSPNKTGFVPSETSFDLSHSALLDHLHFLASVIFRQLHLLVTLFQPNQHLDPNKPMKVLFLLKTR